MDHRANQRVRVESDGDAEEPSVCTAFLGEGTFEQIGSLLTDRGFDSRRVSDPVELSESIEEIECVVVGPEFVDETSVIDDLRALVPNIVCIVLHDDGEAATRAISAGVDRCVHRDADPEALASHLAAAIRSELDRQRAEREGETEPEFIRVALDRLADLFFVFDLDGRFLHWNEQLVNKTGYRDEEIASMEPTAFVAKEDRAAITAAIQRAVETGTGREEADLLTKDGERIPYEFTGSLLENDAGETIGVCGTGRDIADRKRRQRALFHQTDRLRTLNHINEVTREVNQALVRASTREEIERTVCEKLAGKEPYRFAWIGEHGAASERVTPRAWAGVEAGYLDDRPVDHDQKHVTAATAVRTGEIQVAQRITDDPEFEPWREAALERGYLSAIAVPLTYRETTYGVLCVYAPRPEAFDADERAVLSDLGETVAYAIGAAEQRRALMSDTVIELEFGTRDRSIGFVDLSAAASCEVVVDGVTPTGEALVAFLTIRGAESETVLDVVAADSETEATVVAEHDEECVVRLTGPEPSVSGTLAEYGGVVREASAEEGEGRFLVSLPQDADVRAVVDGIESYYEATDLLAQRERGRNGPTDAAIREAFDDALTDRQREVLRVAFLSGYFEWPRDSTGEEVAVVLGISKPTFHEHFRACERKLVTTFFDEKPPVDVDELHRRL